MSPELPAILGDLRRRFGDETVTPEPTCDGVPTAWVPAGRLLDALSFLKTSVKRPFRMLYDLTAVDERARRPARPATQNGEISKRGDFTVVYQLLSLERNEDVRLKVALSGPHLALPTATGVWPSANWYEREVWDMFGVTFDGHPNLRRILMPTTWKGHPLRKEHPARATEMPPFSMDEARAAAEQEALVFRPEEWGLDTQKPHGERILLNLGPQHPGTHGVLRLVLELEGEIITNVVPDIGFHHRAAEKMGERQTWHTYIPYTDRVDYLGGCMNNFPYVMAVEQLAGIRVPDRARMIRIMLAELFRVASHLVWYGTFAQDVGALSPVFYMFTDREQALRIVEAICGGRMHPNWFRIGGVAGDLPVGWDALVRDFVETMHRRMHEYDRMVMQNSIFRGRTRGVGAFSLEEAIEWGVTGPGLRACGLEWDLRKKRPYGGYDQMEFEIPVAEAGDCYARAEVRVEEIRQSLRILRQCVDNMPAGEPKARHPSTTPPLRERTMRDIETLIDHFLGVSWGPVIPAGECCGTVEGTKGLYSYYAVSDGDTYPYRMRIRTPSFPHMQMLPEITRGHMVPDMLAVLGAMDFVLSDVDR